MSLAGDLLDPREERNNKDFSEEKQRKFLAWLDDRWPEEKRICEICSANSWRVLDDLIMPFTFKGEGKPPSIGGAVYPQLMVMCTNCGNTKYFNAVLVGILPNKEVK